MRASPGVNLSSVNLTWSDRVRKVVLGGGVPLVGPQEKLRGPSQHTPRGVYFETKTGGEAKFSSFYEKKQTNKQTRYTYVRYHTRLPMCTCCACFAQNMMMMYQQFPRIWYV